MLLSLVLITAYFREPAGGALHGVQGAGATALRPLELGVERVVRPFRDLYGYLAGLVDAKEENDRLRAEVTRLREEVSQYAGAFQENARLRDLLEYRDSPRFPTDYSAIPASVVAHSPGQYERRVQIAAGSRDGVRRHDPVVPADGLVGHVSQVAPRVAAVTLLTDADSAVTAVTARNGARGMIEPGHGPGDSLAFTHVAKRKVVRRGDVVSTAGWPQGEFGSIYPKGIRIGHVTYVGLTDTDAYQRIQVEPFVDFSRLDAVIVLSGRETPARRPAG